MADRVGQQFGNYRLVRLLGQGGFAEVYLGEHIHLNTQAAIKVLHAQLITTDLQTFMQEARTLVSLGYPNIMRVLDCGIEHGTPFLVMNYASNGTLRQRYPKGTRVPLAQIVSYISQVAPALQYAHDRKLIHRDIKPENMLVGRNGEVMLSDFGIAVISSTSTAQNTKTSAGTAIYMAPEQIMGKPRAASDQYALGIVVYEWLCGDSPFHGSFPELCAQHLYAPPPPLSEKGVAIPAAVEAVVMKALTKDSEQRFASVQEFATVLRDNSPQIQGSASAAELSRRDQSFVISPSDPSWRFTAPAAPSNPTPPLPKVTAPNLPSVPPAATSPSVTPPSPSLPPAATPSNPSLPSITRPSVPTSPSIQPTSSPQQPLYARAAPDYSPTEPMRTPVRPAIIETPPPRRGSNRLAILVVCLLIVAALVAIPVLNPGIFAGSPAPGNPQPGVPPIGQTVTSQPNPTDTSQPNPTDTTAPAPIPTTPAPVATTPATTSPPTVTPTSLDFGTINVDATSQQQQLVISNNNGQALTWQAAPDSNSSWITLDSSSGTLDPGASQTINVTVGPFSQAGTYTGTITISSSDGGTQIVTVTVFAVYT